ncbi:uncharacterized protein BJX67DRAFT_389519 [Aspergillus lucknowensis]|uniref:Zn(2)-C6 fungal-type domain-containing protein n=1 Tax=Aspergillus lucknowensis TaxID=176173 RepID=A0ABR4LL94_9EURO
MAGTTVQKRTHARPAATYPRKRATKACHTCRFRRTKCDNARPSCSSCVRLGADCLYAQADPSTFDPASLAILQRMDELEALIRSKEADMLPVIETSPSEPQTDLCSDPNMPRKHSLIHIEAVLKWPVFEEKEFPARHYPGPFAEDEHALSESANLPISVNVDLPCAESLLQSYFDNVHIFNPILEEEAVREYMKMVCFNGVGWDAMSCLLLLIYAHGSIATPFSNHLDGSSPTTFHHSPAIRQAETYFLAAQKRMGMLLCGSRVIDAQCFFLAGAYLVATLRPVEGWRMFVQALACCQGFLINHPDRTGTEGEWSPKQRIYWTCFKSELELRLELNLPQKSDWDLTYPTFFPTPPNELRTKDEAAWYYYLAEIALRRLGNRILSHLYQSDMASTHESSIEYAVADFEEQMDSWLRSLPEMLALDIPDLQDTEHEALRFILSGHFLDCQEMMYWYFVENAVHYGRIPSATAETYVRKGLRVCVERIQQNRKGFYYRHHGTWLMLRSCARSAFVLLAALRRPELASMLPGDWEESIIDVARMLEFWKDECRDVQEKYEILDALFGVWRGPVYP